MLFHVAYVFVLISVLNDKYIFHRCEKFQGGLVIQRTLIKGMIMNSKSFIHCVQLTESG